MEKIKLKNGKIYNLKVNGIREKGDELVIQIITDEGAETVEAVFSDYDNTQRMEVVTESGELLQLLVEYITLCSIKKEMDVFIGSEETDNGELQEIRSDVITVVLAKADMRDDINQIRAEMRKRFEKLEMQQTVQDGAILDLAGLVGGGE